jgi:hypothetical protein
MTWQCGHRYFFFERVSELMHKQAEIEARLVAVSSCCPALNEVQGSAFDKFRGMVHRVLENHWFATGLLTQGRGRAPWPRFLPTFH